MTKASNIAHDLLQRHAATPDHQLALPSTRRPSPAPKASTCRRSGTRADAGTQPWHWAAR